MRLSLLSAGILFGLIGAIVHIQMHLESERNQPFHLGGSRLVPSVKIYQKAPEEKLQEKSRGDKQIEADEAPKKREIRRRCATMPA